MVDLEKKVFQQYNTYFEQYTVISLAKVKDNLANQLAMAKQCMGNRQNYYLREQTIPEHFKLYKHVELEVDEEATAAYLEIVRAHNEGIETLRKMQNDKALTNKEKRRRQYEKLKEEFANED